MLVPWPLPTCRRMPPICVPCVARSRRISLGIPTSSRRLMAHTGPTLTRMHEADEERPPRQHPCSSRPRRHLLRFRLHRRALRCCSPFATWKLNCNSVARAHTSCCARAPFPLSASDAHSACRAMRCAAGSTIRPRDRCGASRVSAPAVPVAPRRGVLPGRGPRRWATPACQAPDPRGRA
jgi:hypothetical protein